MKMSKSKRMWTTFIFAAILTATGILAITHNLETTANIALGGFITVGMAYLGFESWKKSNH